MKLIGFSSGVVGRDSNVDRMVKAIMEKSGYEFEFIKLNDINYSSCKGCVELCAEPQLCLLEDDLKPYIKKVKEADGVVLGSPVHFGSVSAGMHSFISRLWGFRHVNFVLKEKPFVLALSGIGFQNNNTSVEDFQRPLKVFKVDILDVVSYSSKIPPCYSCGRHQECRLGGAYRLWGDKSRSLTIEPGMFNKWEDNPEAVDRIDEAVEKLNKAVSGK